DVEVPRLLASLRYYVMLCRDLPHYTEHDVEENFVTKLKFLMKLSFPTEQEFDYETKAEQERAIKTWEKAKIHENYFNLPHGSRWIGDINALALELFSTLCYEAEKDPAKKFEAFNKHYSHNILERNEDLTEVYFKTWNRHLEYYCQERTSFMERLKFYIDIFPRNDVLTMLYISILRHDEAETRWFFLLNQHDDDIVKVVRCIIQNGTEFENIRKHTRKSNYNFYFDILKNSAEKSSTNLIPESYLWRSALFFIKYTKATAFYD
uniref:DUF262 domain-containing protein n=1 Tax=Panagrolaimus sp. ES5 TaxID=591445 RepID=A0AC34GGL0_9BILA